jgi:hypothetical protein
LSRARDEKVEGRAGGLIPEKRLGGSKLGQASWPASGRGAGTSFIGRPQA